VNFHAHIAAVALRGLVLTPLDIAGVERTAQIFRCKEVEAVAVCFINAYVDGRYERAARRILQEQLSGVHISVSHEALPEIFEFERASTTVPNAALADRKFSYEKNRVSLPKT
jgi:N-methylhydantoinase A